MPIAPVVTVTVIMMAMPIAAVNWIVRMPVVAVTATTTAPAFLPLVMAG